MLDLPNRRIAGLLTTFALGLTVAACGNDPVEVEEEIEPEVATMRLTVGSQVVEVNEAGVVTGGPITIGTGNTSISVQWLKNDGTQETIVTEDVFQLDADSNDTGVVDFSRTGAFAGNLVGVAAGSTTIDFSLFHIEEGHEDFGPFPVPVTVS